jgi:hypothetical protein
MIQQEENVQLLCDVSYNQAPGAVKAEAIELRKGLFFTVQIGVYNKPVTAGVLK